MLHTFYILIFISVLASAFGQTIKPKNIKTIYKYCKFADTLRLENNKFTWLDEKKEFYPNGLLKTHLHMALGDNPRDTSYYLKYEINEDSTLKLESEYRSYKSGWNKKALYRYSAGIKKPIGVKLLDSKKGKKIFEYNEKMQLVSVKILYGKKNTLETRYFYDSLNRLTQKVDYTFKEGVKNSMFFLYNYEYKQYPDSLTCTMENYLIQLKIEDQSASEVSTFKIDINPEKHYRVLNYYSIITTYNSLNEIISEVYFNKSLREESLGEKTLHRRHYYTYEYYK